MRSADSEGAASAPAPHPVGDAPLALRDIVALARPGTRIALTAPARARVARARAVVDRHPADGAPVYGLNTGLGGNLGHRLDPAEVEAFQAGMIVGRCVGVGPPLPRLACRAALLCRILGLAAGGAGISPPVLDLLVAMFNAGVTPVIPGRGSIGAGDLGLVAHLGAVAIGRGQAWVGGDVLPGAEALRRAGLAPAVLAPKDGIGLINANCVSAGHGAVVLAELAGLLLLASAAAALSMEGYAANPAIFDPRIAAARPARGQAEAAALFRALLGGSALHDPGAARSIQDALSFRTAAPVLGTALSALADAAAAIETEANAAADNPLVLPPDGPMLSTANFHTPAIALAFDALAIALAGLAAGSAYRTTKLMTPGLSGLPKYLSPVGGASNGLNSLQKTASALHAEIRLRAAPAALDAIPVSETVEDHAPQTHLAIRKLEEQLLPLRLLVAVEALTAAQAVDLRRPPRLASATRALHDAIRARVPPLTEDREPGPDADAVVQATRDPALAAALLGHVPEAGMAAILRVGADPGEAGASPPRRPT